ncbi:uncharacterized protein LOC135488275 [Lineus longissimus]|uniref:uncharacterized protein LOC135488275 n=1 Tax=Lineus longissimus TaxID=88925 RepID=UPI00315CC883
MPASSLTGITVDEIKAIPAAEFKTCYSKLGVPVWNKTKCDELYKRIKTDVANGNMCTTTVQILQDTKNILLCMPVADIDCQLFDTDAKTKAFGDLSGWTFAQLTTLGTRYKKATGVKYKPVDFTDTTIKALGRILCGLPANDLTTINPANFKTALPAQNAAKIYDTCPKDPVLANLLTVCKQATAYGPIKGWTSSIISEVGILLSAATPEDVKTLGANIKEVDQSALQNMNKASLQAIAPENALNLPSTLQNSLGVGSNGTATGNNKKASSAGYVKLEHFLLAGTVTFVFWVTGRY